MSKSLRKALDVLDQLAIEPASLSELARAAKTPPSSMHRMLSELESLELVRRVNKTYHLGVRLISLGEAARHNLQIPEISKEAMVALSRDTKETVHLGLLDGQDIIYIGKEEGRRGLQMASYIGLRSPAQTTAMGKTLIADLPEKAWEPFTQEIQRRTEFTVTDPDAYRDELATVRRQGYAFDREENELGIRCIAAPIRDSSGRAVAAISLSGADTYVTKQRQMDLVPDVVACALDISRQLGYRPKETPSEPKGS